MSRRVAVLSAHEGSASWRAMLSLLEKSGRITIHPISGYSDDEYRTSRSPRARALLRLKTYVAFPLKIMWRAGEISRRFDTIIVITSPFYLPAIVGWLVRGPRIVTLQNDIYPEALIVKKLIRRNGIIDRVLSRIVASGLRRADTVVYITDAHRAHVARVLNTPTPGDVVIHAPSHLEPQGQTPQTSRRDKSIVALYTGTLGMMHDTSTFLEFLARRGPPPNVRFMFRTSGAGKASLEKTLRSKFPSLITSGVIEIGDPLADAEWADMMRSADIGLVFQDVGAGDVVFPSKAASVLVCGQALLAIADRSSSIGQLVVSSNCGWIVPPGNLDALQSALDEAAVPAILAEKKNNALRLGREQFALDVVADRWLEVLTR
jgi:colanic acid biosynthesis glycosyl transferase WcaI